MITPRQFPVAHTSLGWPQQPLADKTIVSLNAVTRLEKGVADSHLSILSAIEKAISKAGIMFLPADEGGDGVRLKSPKA